MAATAVVAMVASPMARRMAVGPAPMARCVAA
jgi:hypothetical protein